MQETYDAAISSGTVVDDATQRDALPKLEELRTFLTSNAAKKGLRGLISKPRPTLKGIYLWGGVGRGKSMLMDMFYAATDVPKRRVHFHAFMQEIHAGIHKARKTGVDDALKPVATAVSKDIRLLAFDEMQISDITDAMIVGRLFERLFAAGVVIISTSNRPPDDLYKDGLNRQLFVPFIEMINQQMAVHELVAAKDYRRDRLGTAEVYFEPINGAAHAAVDGLWKVLAGGAGDPLALDVNGREFILPAFRNGVARADFWDLCGRAVGAADYLALAAVAKVVILENVPRLDRDNYNEARRFVTLIDTLYEAKVRLIMSAADLPDRLYLEGAGSFEFERTVSRLREMQSDGWGVA